MRRSYRVSFSPLFECTDVQSQAPRVYRRESRNRYFPVTSQSVRIRIWNIQKTVTGPRHIEEPACFTPKSNEFPSHPRAFKHLRVTPYRELIVFKSIIQTKIFSLVSGRLDKTFFPARRILSTMAVYMCTKK